MPLILCGVVQAFKACLAFCRKGFLNGGFRVQGSGVLEEKMDNQTDKLVYIGVIGRVL